MQGKEWLDVHRGLTVGARVRGRKNTDSPASFLGEVVERTDHAVAYVDWDPEAELGQAAYGPNDAHLLDYIQVPAGRRWQEKAVAPEKPL